MIKFKMNNAFKKVLCKVNYNYNMPWDRYVRAIYDVNDDSETSKYYSRNFMLKCICVIFISIVLLTISMCINHDKEMSLYTIENNEINNVNYDVNEKIDVLAKYKLNDYEITGQYNINLPRNKMSDEEVVNEVLKSINDKSIKGENESLKEITSPLNLFTDNKYNAEIEWSSDVNNVDAQTGNVIRNYKGEGDKKVNLKVFVKYGTVKKVKIFYATVKENDFTKDEIELLEAGKVIDEKIRDNEIYETNGSKSKLVSQIGNVEIEWQVVMNNEEDNNKEVILLILIITSLIIYNEYQKLKKKSDNKIRECEMYFSRFIEQFIILLSAGFTPYTALKYISDNNKEKNELVTQLRRVCNQVTSGIPIYKALENFEKNIGSKMISKFTYSMIYNMKRGDSELVNFLRNELIESSKHVQTLYTIKVKENNIKMIVPLMINFISVLIVVVYPAITNLKI